MAKAGKIQEEEIDEQTIERERDGDLWRTEVRVDFSRSNDSPTVATPEKATCAIVAKSNVLLKITPPGWCFIWTDDSEYGDCKIASPTRTN